jgi:hypothetical protein
MSKSEKRQTTQSIHVDGVSPLAFMHCILYRRPSKMTMIFKGRGEEGDGRGCIQGNRREVEYADDGERTGFEG